MVYAFIPNSPNKPEQSFHPHSTKFAKIQQALHNLNSYYSFLSTYLLWGKKKKKTIKLSQQKSASEKKHMCSVVIR